MTQHTAYQVQDGTVAGAESRRQIVRKAAEIALILVFAAALTAAWLAFFMFVPLDFTLGAAVGGELVADATRG
jgi:hypothetical protein